VCVCVGMRNAVLLTSLARAPAGFDPVTLNVDGREGVDPFSLGASKLPLAQPRVPLTWQVRDPRQQQEGAGDEDSLAGEEEPQSPSSQAAEPAPSRRGWGGEAAAGQAPDAAQQSGRRLTGTPAAGGEELAAAGPGSAQAGALEAAAGRRSLQKRESGLQAPGPGGEARRGSDDAGRQADVDGYRAEGESGVSAPCCVPGTGWAALQGRGRRFGAWSACCAARAPPLAHAQPLRPPGLQVLPAATGPSLPA